MDAVRDEAHGQIEVRVEPCSDDHVRMVVVDNGPGVVQELVPKLFEPYVTTKSHGTGLGLPIVQRIVVEHGGEITYCRPGQGGACFSVVLPCSGPSPASTPTPEISV